MKEESKNIEKTENKKHLVMTDINNIPDVESCYGYWQTYMFNKEKEEYEPIYSQFIYYKGRFFDNLETRPWNDEAIEKVRLLSNYMNRNNEPICIFRHERGL